MAKKKKAPVFRSGIRPAQLVADAVAVLCPYCGEPQPNPKDGSDLWEQSHFRAIAKEDSGKRQCAACDATMHVWSTPKVMFT